MVLEVPMSFLVVPSISNLSILSEPKAKAKARVRFTTNKSSHTEFVREVFDVEAMKTVKVRVIEQYHSIRTPDEKGYLRVAEFDTYNSTLRLYVDDVTKLEEMYAKFNTDTVDPSAIADQGEQLT